MMARRCSRSRQGVPESKRTRCAASGQTQDTYGQAGLLSTELAILMPVMLLIAVLAVFVVQVERHGSRAQQAADAAARAASLTFTLGGDPGTAAQEAADAVCFGTATATIVEVVAADVDSFTPGRVQVSVSCSERFSGFEPLADDTTRTESATAVSVIEYWIPGQS